MKHSHDIIVFIFLCFAHYARAEKTTVAMLNPEGYQCYALSADANSPVWDFSGCAIIDNNSRAEFSCYGDTIATDVFAGQRFWFDTRDRWSWMGDETRNQHVWRDSMSTVDNDFRRMFTARGRYADRLNIARQGFDRMTVSPVGKLVLCDGDTLNNVVCRTVEMQFVAKLSQDSISFPLLIEQDSLQTYNILYSRWENVSAPHDLPYALMVTTKVYFPDGVAADSATVCGVRIPDAFEYVTMDDEDSNEIPNLLPSPERAQQILSNAVIGCFNGSVSVSLPADADDLHMRIDITDMAGHKYFSREYEWIGEPINIDVSRYEHGDYIIVLATPTSTLETVTHKEFIHIY